MTILEKLNILGLTSRYDASCGGPQGKKESQFMPGIYRSTTNDGGCSSLLKILLTNYCEYDCAYCVNRNSNNVSRTIFTADEICKITTEYYNKGLIDGLFLSSGVLKNPDFTMELMIKAVKRLRLVYNFTGYIHLKIMPGSDYKLIDEAVKYADRVSVNLEIPSRDGLSKLCPQKNEDSLFKPMVYINEKLSEKKSKKLKLRSSGQTTQLIVGAIDDNDFQILKLADNLYKKIALKRVYYSAFVNVNNLPSLPNENDRLSLRERRLYQADWLIRLYKFNLDEILKPKSNLSLELDPKTEWALKNIEIFPIEINHASYEELLRIPGIGFVSAKKIIEFKKYSPLNMLALDRMGIRLNKARHFITVNGKYYGYKGDNIDNLKEILLEKDSQLSLFTE
ncbi:MAG: putative DNA modification/repair radical SAM protein [Brevinematia bacterium]